jgi:hypothetical protein
MAVMASRAQDVLKVMAGKDVTAPMLNAAYAVHLGRALTAPIIVVEGTLSVAGEPVAQDHGWVMIGPWVADMALFSRAYAPDAPPRPPPMCCAPSGRARACSAKPGAAPRGSAWAMNRAACWQKPK